MTYILQYTTAKGFMTFVETEQANNNLISVDLYFNRSTGLSSIIKTACNDEFVFTFVNMTIQSARGLKNRLFEKLCKMNKNFMVQLKTM